MLTIILIILAGLYLLFIVTRKKKWTLDEMSTKRLRMLHFVIFILLVVLAFLANNNIYLRGYWTTKVIIWMFVLTAITLFAFGYRPSQRKAERFYLGFFFYSPLTLIPLAFVPFFGIVIPLSIYGFTIGSADDIQYSDSRYRLQSTYRGFLAPASPPDLFVKHGLFEYKEKPLPVDYFGNCDSIRIENLKENEIEIRFYHHHQFTESENPIKVVVQIGDEE
jgi:hypothetical protein